jgi:hypothetical protein
VASVVLKAYCPRISATTSVVTMISLPKAGSPSAHVDVSLIRGGKIGIPDYCFHENGTRDEIVVPDYAFLIEHRSLGKKVFFDLGLNKVYSILTSYPN